MGDAMTVGAPDVALTPSMASQMKSGPGAGLDTSGATANLVNALLASRKKHVDGRKNSGIEEDWIEDEEHYQGIDDANRGTMRSWIMSIKRGMFSKEAPNIGARSSVFLNITGPYVDSAAARVGDMLVPVDDRCWELKPTPVPELSAILQKAIGAANSEQLKQKLAAVAEACSEGMENAIDDLLVECYWHAEVRKVIEDAARIGSGVLKGPFAVSKKQKKYGMAGARHAVQMLKKVTVASKSISPWNFFPDPACGDNIHDGSGTWERDYITEKVLVGMVGLPGYRAFEIGQCAKEGPTRHSGNRETGNTDYVPIDDQFQRWHFYGRLPAADLKAAGIAVNDDGLDDVDIMAVLVNDRLIKVDINVLDTGEFPYDVLAWRARPGIPWGVGIARQVRTAQRILNGAARALMDNAGGSAAPQIVLRHGVQPADGRMEIHRPKVWLADENVDDARKAFYAWMPESRQAELMAIIEFALKMGEETTGLPLLLQGQQGEATKTVAGMQMLQNNASGTMRRLAKRFDDYLTAPHISRFFDWYMQYGEDESIKGDCQVEVRASSALVEKDAQKQFLFAAANLAENPIFGINPYNLFKQLTLSERMDPKTIQYPPEEFAQMQKDNKDPVAESQAEMNSARAEQARASAAQTTVDALFAAANTAAVVASNTALAPAADAIAKSAGVRDANAPPLIPSVAPGAPGPMPGQPGALPEQPQSEMPVPQNTSPNFPPRPAAPPSATLGAGTGIEGGGP